MATNLLRPNWGHLNKVELRILLAERIGRPGQYDNREANPNRLYLPLAGSKCRVVLTFCGREIVSVEPGEGFDTAQWDAIVEEIETSVLTGPNRVGRDYSFSSYRVPGNWRGLRSGVQILPPHLDAPLVPFEMGEHPYILEFPVQEARLWPLTNHRRMREHRTLTLLLNVLLRGRMNLQFQRPGHFWGCIHGEGAEFQMKWVQASYFAPLGKCILNEASPTTTDQLQEIDSDHYYTATMGMDGLPLRVPADLDNSICLYKNLAPRRRAEFDRAAYWLDIASRQWDFSMSASYASLVSVIESLINEDGHGSNKRFQAFIERYAPGASLASRRTQMYKLRSEILHGSSLMVLDQELALAADWDPPWWNERELHEELWTLTRVVARNWLKNPPTC